MVRVGTQRSQADHEQSSGARSPISRFDSARELVAAIQRLALARSLPEIQVVVRSAARRLTGADGATFVLCDEGRCFYADEGAISPLWKGRHPHV
jgi:hypothetical protein